MWNLFLWKEERSLQSFKLILVDLSYESQKYKLCNIVLFKFTASNAYLYKHGENHKSYGQTHS